MTNNPNDDAQSEQTLFDRLVDGELSTAERQTLLASLDDREQGWRRCALAFLESQAWGGEFKSFVHEPTRDPVTPPSKSVHLNRWFAVAAGLMFAFSLGWLSRATPDPSSLNGNIVSLEQQEILLGDEPLSGESRDAVTLVVRDTSGKNQRLRVPLMDVDAPGNQFASALPINMRERFHNQGFDVQRRRRFAPMFFEQNQELVPMVVPVDDTVVVPVSRPIY